MASIYQRRKDAEGNPCGPWWVKLSIGGKLRRISLKTTDRAQAEARAEVFKEKAWAEYAASKLTQERPKEPAASTADSERIPVERALRMLADVLPRVADHLSTLRPGQGGSKGDGVVPMRRAAVFFTLASRKESLSVSEVAKLRGLADPVASRHLRDLRSLGLVHAKKTEDKRSLQSLTPTGLAVAQLCGAAVGGWTGY